MTKQDKKALMWTGAVAVGLVVWYMWKTKSGPFMPEVNPGGSSSATTSAPSTTTTMPVTSTPINVHGDVLAQVYARMNNGVAVPAAVYQPAATVTGIPKRRIISSCV